MNISYDVTAAEVRAGQRLLIPDAPLAAHGRVYRKPSGSNGLAGWLLFLVLALVLFMLLHNRPQVARTPRRGMPAPPAAAPFADLTEWSAAQVVAAVCGMVVISSLPLMSRASQIAKRIPPGMQTFSFADDGMTRHTENEWRRWPWAALHSFAETDDLFVIRTSRDKGIVFPKRLLSEPSQVESLRSMLAEQLTVPAQPTGGLDYAAS